MSKFFKGVFFLMLLVNIGFAEASENKNLLYNGDFRDIAGFFPKGWTAVRSKVTLDQENKWKDSNSIRLAVAQNGFVTCKSSPVSVKPNTAYTISWFCRTSDFENARAYVFLETNGRQHLLPDCSMHGNGEWTEFKVSYLPNSGIKEFQVVLVTHGKKGADTKNAAAWFADISVTENNLVNSGLSEDEMTIKFPVVRALGCVKNGSRYSLDPLCFVQEKSQDYIAIEAENGTVKFLPQGGVKDSNGETNIDFVAHADYSFWIENPGVYYRWIRTWRPAVAHFCHSESIDNGDPGPMLADYDKKVEEWEWVRGPEYNFKTPGFHNFTLHNFYAGIKLDKIIFSSDKNFDPNKSIPKETARRYPSRGELYTSSYDIMQIKKWLSFSLKTAPVSAPVEVFWTDDSGKNYNRLDTGSLNLPLWKNNTVGGLSFKIVISPTDEDVKLNRIPNIAVADSATVTSEIDSSQIIRIGDNKQEIIVNKINGSLCGIFNKESKKWCYHRGTCSSPFALTLYDPESLKTRLLHAEQFELVGSDFSSSMAKFIYHSKADNISVTTSFALGDEGLSKWKITVENNGKKQIVLRTMFPYFSSLHIGDGNGDDVLIFPQGLVKKLRLGDHALAKRTFFPGSMSMGWIDLYDESSGFYASIDDERMIMTGMYAGTSKEKDGMEVLFEKNHGIMPQSSETWSYTIGVHSGDWHWAADQYRKWAATCIKKYDAPKWLRESNGLYCYSGQWIGKEMFKRLPDAYKAAKNYGLDGLQVWGQQSYPKGPCGDAFYFPSPHFGTEDELTNADEKIHKLGGHIGFYQWMNWNVTYEDSSKVAFDTVEKKLLPPDIYIPRKGYAEDNQLITEEGKSHFFTLTCMKNQQCTLMCSLQQEHRDYLQYYTRRYAEKYKADGFYMDEGLCTARICFNRRHGHIGNGETGREMANALRDIWETGRKYNPDFYLTAEVPSCLAGQYAAQFVGVFEPDIEIVKYTFPHQLYLDGNLPVARQESPFEALRDIFMVGNHLMLFTFPKFFSGENLEVIMLRRNLRKFFAYATYKDKVGITVNDKSIDCRIFDIDFDGNTGIMLTVSNPGQVSNATVSIKENKLMMPNMRGFAVCLDGSVIPLEVSSSDGSATLPLPKSKLSAIVVLGKVSPAWSLLPVISRVKKKSRIEYSIKILNFSGENKKGACKLDTANGDLAIEEFNVQPYSACSVKASLPCTSGGKDFMQCSLSIESQDFEYKDIDFVK